MNLVDLYEALLDTYPGYEKNDLVLYQLARAHELNGEPELARYNDPWTPGFLRTNEIWVVVDEASANAAASAPP